MSCNWRPIATTFRCALPLILLAAAPSAAFPQSSACHAIRSGETATQLARRLTGDGRNKYQPWFQIVDASSRPVPKSQYDRIRAGWRACLARETNAGSVRPAAQPDVREARAIAVAVSPPAAADVVRTLDDVSPWSVGLESVDLRLVWLGAALILPLVGLLLDNYAGRRRAVLIVMKHFAHRFVCEFERPLIQQPAEHPLRSRLRASPVRGRLDILLAPAQGRRYPNLSDHKKNVEYDVSRIVRLLADESFVRDPLYTRAGWVVVPFRFKVGSKRTGVTCISSY
jgi:hypothetical protein